MLAENRRDGAREMETLLLDRNFVDLQKFPVLHCPHLRLHSQASEIKAIFVMG
jgi:hypothetical protein